MANHNEQPRPSLDPAGIPIEDPAIEIVNLGKEYKIYDTPSQRLLEWLPFGGTKSRHRSVFALKDINLTVGRGRTVGLVGPNGAGKSTLLKILTGTTFPTKGRYSIQGKVASLLELGAGFHADFTGRENIYLNAAMLGLSREETEEKFEEILEFSELAPFIDSPIRTYSSGMVCRLGFSTAIAVDPEVLIIDEILAVGDLHFQKKCVEKIWSFKERGKTILFCSHSLYDVRQLCDRAVWIHKGGVRMFDDAVAVTNAYATYEKELVGRETDVLEALPGEKVEGGAKGPHIVSIDMLDANSGESVREVQPLADLCVRVHWKNPANDIPLAIGVGFTRTDSTHCLGHSTEQDGIELRGSEGVLDLILPKLRLLSGEFVVFVWLMDERGIHRFHQMLAPRNLLVMNRGMEVGLFLQDHEWQARDPMCVLRDEEGT